MEQNRLVLNDGTTIKDGFASKSSRNQLMIRVPGDDILQAVLLFGDKWKTGVIVCYYGIHKTTYTGYTNMYFIQHFAEENYVELWLAPPEGGETSTEEELTVPKEYVPAESGTSIYDEEPVEDTEESVDEEPVEEPVTEVVDEPEETTEEVIDDAGQNDDAGEN